MVSFFSSRRKTEKHGFNRYAEEINRYQQNSVAGVPNISSNRNDSLSYGAGAAAMAALRIHQQPQPEPPQQYTRASSMTARLSNIRANSLTLASVGNNSNRANSLRSYVYHPKASYVVGQPHQPPQPSQLSSAPPRLNSLNSNSSPRRNVSSIRASSLNSQSSRSRQPQYHHIPTSHDDILFEEEGIESTITVTKTTKVIDAQGRTQSITTETIRTLADGSNIIETRTKNISRSNSLTNASLLPPVIGNVRANSIQSHQGANNNLSKIEEDLQDFDYSYHEAIQSRNVNISNGIAPSAPTTVPKELSELPSPPQQHSPVLEAALGDSPKPKPLRSILKNSAKNADSLKENGFSPSEPSTPQNISLNNSPIALVSPKVGSTVNGSQNSLADAEHFSDALETFEKRKSSRIDGSTAQTSLPHPYHGLKANTSPDSTSSPPALQPSPELNISKKPFTSLEADKKKHLLFDHLVPISSASSGSGSIKFLENIETIPVSTTSNKKQLSESEMYEKALEVARTKVYGSANAEIHAKALEIARANVYHENLSIPGPPEAVVHKEVAPRQELLKSNQAKQAQPERRTMSITSNISSLLVEARRNKKANLASPTKLSTSQQANSSHLNEDEILTGAGVKDDYNYHNHHKDFKRHSMRGNVNVAESKRKDRAKEEKNFLKLQAKEEKNAQKLAAKEAVELRKKTTKEESEAKKLRAKEELEARKAAAKSKDSRVSSFFRRGSKQAHGGATSISSGDYENSSIGNSQSSSHQEASNHKRSISIDDDNIENNFAVAKSEPIVEDSPAHLNIIRDIRKVQNTVTDLPVVIVPPPSEKKDAPFELDLPKSSQMARDVSKIDDVENYVPSVKEPLPHPSVIDTNSIHSSIMERLEESEEKQIDDEEENDEPMLDDFARKLRAAALRNREENPETAEKESIVEQIVKPESLRNIHILDNSLTDVNQLSAFKLNQTPKLLPASGQSTPVTKTFATKIEPISVSHIANVSTPTRPQHLILNLQSESIPTFNSSEAENAFEIPPPLEKPSKPSLNQSSPTSKRAAFRHKVFKLFVNSYER